METATPAGPPPRDAPAPDVTGPDITPVGLPSRARISGHTMSPVALALAALAGIGLASLIDGMSRLAAPRLPGPLPASARREL